MVSARCILHKVSVTLSSVHTVRRVPYMSGVMYITPWATSLVRILARLHRQQHDTAIQKSPQQAPTRESRR